MEIKPLDELQHWLLLHTWVIEVSAALALLLFLNILLDRTLQWTKQKAHLQEKDWRIHIDSAVLAPAKILLWVLLISFLFHLASQRLGLETLFPYIPSLRNAGIVFCLAWFSLRWKKLFFNALAARRIKGKLFFDPSSLEILGKFFTAGVVFVSLLIILGLFGIDILPLVTFGGIGVAALGLASRNAAANFLGGLMLYINRPFTTCDLIELPGKKISGYVEQIGWHHTSIRDLQKKPIYVPNSLFSTEILINLSRITHRSIEEILQIRYADYDKASFIIEEIRTLFKQSPEIDPHQPLHVHLLTLGAAALEIHIKAYTLSTRYEEFIEIKQKLLLQISSILAKSGAATLQI